VIVRDPSVRIETVIGAKTSGAKMALRIMLAQAGRRVPCPPLLKPFDVLTLCWPWCCVVHIFACPLDVLKLSWSPNRPTNTIATPWSNMAIA